MIGYRCEITAIDIVDYENELSAKITAFDECASEVQVTPLAHTVDSWRELSAKIEEALLQIHPAITPT